ncbi:XisI protein [Spirosoma linguale]|uniref:XisI protein n=1 Tax=Spirosoma linguale (strain ATCC 33905 / DSM 74 / LMG 10896 / Claus 1) TaxID=504472 RepID=D2QNY9_SPILD|nr:XisI protein [Spirosoma linguale DSM 74]
MNNKIETHQQIVMSILNEYAAIKPAHVLDVDNQVIADYHNNHFQLVRLGWDEEEDFIYHLIFHFDIKPDGKVWIQANWTDIDIATELMERGVEKSDIVIGFQPPSHRQYTGYAVA